MKLRDEPDKSHNRFVPFAEYLDTRTRRDDPGGPRAGNEIDPRLLVLSAAGGRPGCLTCRRLSISLANRRRVRDARDWSTGLEIEPNLVGSTGKLMATLAEQCGRGRTWF